jgi:hypothetical protein
MIDDGLNGAFRGAWSYLIAHFHRVAKFLMYVYIQCTPDHTCAEWHDRRHFGDDSSRTN